MADQDQDELLQWLASLAGEAGERSFLDTSTDCGMLNPRYEHRPFTQVLEQTNSENPTFNNTPVSSVTGDNKIDFDSFYSKSVSPTTVPLHGTVSSTTTVPEELLTSPTSHASTSNVRPMHLNSPVLTAEADHHDSGNTSTSSTQGNTPTCVHPTTTTSTVRNNSGVPVGILKQHLPMWKWSCNAIPNRSVARRVLGIIENGMELEFQEDPPPPSTTHQQRNYVKVNSPEGRWVTQQLKILVEHGSTRRAKRSECTFILPIFVVPKDNGSGMRMIVDMRALNILLKKHKFTLPSLSKHRAEFNSLLGMFVYDLTSSFQHVEIAEKDQQYFGIEWDGELYLMTVCPYGCASVPEVFQTVAGLPVRVANTIGLSPDVTTVAQWKSIARGDCSLPPTHRRFRITTKQYLDDYGSLIPPAIRSMDGTVCTGDALRILAPQLSASFKALLQAHGLTISKKSAPDPFVVNKFLGWNVNTSVSGGTFSIPSDKLKRNIALLEHFAHTPVWTIKQGAQITGRILQFKLIWGAEASLLARPIYHELATSLLSSGNDWHRSFQPTPLVFEMVYRALAMLRPGPDQFIQGKILDHQDQLIQLWEQGFWSLAEQMWGDAAPDIAATDASDLMTGGWHSTEGLEATLAQDEYTVRTAKSGPMLAQLLPDEAIVESSTLREVLGVRDWFASEEVMHHTMSRIRQYNKKGLLHLLDSQAAVIILRKGSSRVPAIHRLVLEIYDLTRVLRRQYGLVFAWVPREKNQIADTLSKTHGYCIQPHVFAAYHKKLRFTLDAFAAPHERVSSDIPFCSRFVHPAALGSAQVCDWSNQVVWAMPPPNTKMISLALRKWNDTPVTAMVLCVPAWRNNQHIAWWDLVWHAPWESYQLVRRAATLITGLDDSKRVIKKLAQFPFYLFLFKRANGSRFSSPEDQHR